MDNKRFSYHTSNLKIEDLLMRDEIQIDMNLIEEKFKDKTVLVTGAAGSIGSELCRQLGRIGVGRLILYDYAESPIHTIRLELNNLFPNMEFTYILGDVRMKRRVERVIATYKPDIIFHAAAYKHVPLMEEHPCEAITTNVYGTKMIADMAVKYGVKQMILVSTDKAVNPTNVMGASKRLAEIYVQSLGLAIESGEEKGNTTFITTRFGNVLGSQGSVIPLFKMQIDAGGPVTVTHPDITRFFMTIPEACKLVVEAATIGRNNEIVVFDMGKSIRIVDLAYRMIELCGFVPEKDIQIVYTGLRPGEKLFEEVLNCEENTIPTSVDKIRVAEVRQYCYQTIKPFIKKIVSSALDGDEMRTIRLLKKIILEFQSKNSRFEVLDNSAKAV